MVVYPRWRGELTNDAPKPRLLHGLSPLARGTLSPCGKRVRFRGLSPLARGTLINLVYIGLRGRFIPAGAGTPATDFTRAQAAVYPRWRGELSNLRSVCKSAGLSPLARGTRGRSPAQSAPCRFIPAGAGNSKSQIFAKARATVYPRWRGELIGVFSFDAGLYGLSPLARGTLRYAGSNPAQTVYPRWRGELTKHNLLLIIDF